MLTGAMLAAAPCSDSNSTTSPTTSSSGVRSYDQVQRLGNPLLSEVFLAKKDHLFHGSIGPDADVAALTPSVKGFVTAFRPNAVTLQNTLATVLLPDMLIVQTDKATSSARWAELGAVEWMGRTHAHR
ncbi:MAG TPA: hypothetical protein VHV78_09955 [Gemmatimonadaceae bacterium]|jgi:hypothetical protein|nr:hypothetical protein [Gemmatimonadaceae bacterium]